VYNGERFVVEAVRSALGQTYPPLEVIVVDDASTDRTGKLIQQEFAPQIISGAVHYVRNERNMERSFSRNEGVRLARGLYVFFLDYDDLWKPAYLETVMEVLGQDGVDLVYSFPRTFIDERGQVLRSTAKWISADAAELVFASQVGYPSATAIKRKSFPGYAGECILREDWEIFLKAQLAGLRITVLDHDQVRMRAHGGRSSRNVKFWRSTLWVHEHYQARIPRNYRGRFFYHVADVCLRYGDLPRGWRLGMQALMAGTLPDLRMVHRFLTRGVRLDRYFSLAAERRKLVGGDAP
jgi:glycosyltransferase involved in cell wall biosynthesis